MKNIDRGGVRGRAALGGKVAMNMMYEMLEIQDEILIRDFLLLLIRTLGRWLRKWKVWPTV